MFVCSCQDVFLKHVQLEDNIARNQALKENVFMMVVCIELRIPLFLVGKPGSSKSLAKTIVSDAMQRDAAHNDLFRGFKLVIQCLTTNNIFTCSLLNFVSQIITLNSFCYVTVNMVYFKQYSKSNHSWQG